MPQNAPCAVANGPAGNEPPAAGTTISVLLKLVAKSLQVGTVILMWRDRDEFHVHAAAVSESVPRVVDSPLVRLLCRWVVRSSAPMVLADARAHPLARDFSDGSLGESGFAGVPVYAPGGEVVGSLCVVGEGARAWTPREVALLTEAAEEAGSVGITVARAAEATASGRERDEWTDRALQLNPLPAWIFDLETLRFLAVNEAAIEQYGYSREEFLNRTVRDIRTAASMAALERTLGTKPDGIFRRAEITHQTKDGTIIDVEVTTQEVPYAGRTARLAVVLDNTEKRRSAERNRFLAEASALLTTTLDYKTRLAALASLSVPRLADFCVVEIVEDDDAVHRLEAAHADPGNEELVRELLRFPPLQKRSQGVSRALQSGETVLIPEIDDEVFQSVAQSPGHLVVLRRLGARTSLSVPLVVRGRVLGAISFAMAESGRRYHPHDVELAEEVARRAAIALDNAWLYRRAQQAIRARDEILGVVSHELRNPLNATLLTLEMLLDAGTQEVRGPQRQKLESVRWFAGQMVRLVDDLVDVTRAEAGQLFIRPQQQEVQSLVAAAVGSMLPIAEARGIRIATEIPAGIPVVHADRARVLQVFGNLLGNAIRLTPPGGAITIRAEPMGKEIRFAVSDTGPGIEEEQLSTLFDRTERKAKDSSAGGGLGLGLVIASGIVRAHHGEIWVESIPGEGSSFFFTLPVAAAAGDESASSDWEEFLKAIPIFGPAADGDGRPGAEPAAATTPKQKESFKERQADFLAEVSRADPQASAPELVDPTSYLRHRITTALHLGHLRPGDRLPSIREVARVFGTSHHITVQAYNQLAAEGLIEKRERSGVYVADPMRRGSKLQVETGQWLAEVLIEACEHQLRIPKLPELIERWTASVRLRCACIESDKDNLAALCAGYAAQFGFDCIPVSPDVLTLLGSDKHVPPLDLPEEILGADILVTTAFQAPAVRAAAEALRKPLVVATADPEVIGVIERRLREGGVTLVCADPLFGERVHSYWGSALAERIRVVLASDAAAVAELDPSEPVLLTRAAREALGDVQLRLVAPQYPAFSLDATRELARLLVQLNLTAERRTR